MDDSPNYNPTMTSSTDRLQVQSAHKVPGHSMYGDWGLPGREYSYISLDDLVRTLGAGRRPVHIAHAEICAKPGDWFGTDDFIGPRFEAADARYPGIVVAAMPNPCQLPFRLIDGRRRLEKLRRKGISKSAFYVFTFDEVQPFIIDYDVVPSS